MRKGKLMALTSALGMTLLSGCSAYGLPPQPGVCDEQTLVQDITSECTTILNLVGHASSISRGAACGWVSVAALELDRSHPICPPSVNGWETYVETTCPFITQIVERSAEPCDVLMKVEMDLKEAIQDLQGLSGAFAEPGLESANKITIGSVTNPNPFLWLDVTSLGASEQQYQVATEVPNPPKDWTDVNQFCSILAVDWLLSSPTRPTQFGFADLSDPVQAAETLIGFESLQDQVQYAEQQLGGQSVDRSQFLADFDGYGSGTLIWLASDRHVMAAVKKNGLVEFYDPDAGVLALLPSQQLVELVDNEQWINAFVVKQGQGETGDAEDAELVDPNCHVDVVQGGPIANYGGPPTNQQTADATDAIAQLTFADIWRLPPFRIQQNTVRLDVQGVLPGGGRNWQVQINGVKSKSTIAHANIQGTLAGASTAERQRYVERKMRNALVESLREARSYDVTGDCN